MNGSRGQVAVGGTAFTSAVPPALFFPFADGGVVFRPGTRRLLVLNASAALVWCLLTESADLDELVEIFARHFTIDPITARRDVKAVLGEFEQAGLFRAGDQVVNEAEDMRSTGRFDPAPEPARWALRQKFTLSQLVVEFCCADLRLGRAFAACLAHLSTADADAGARLAVLPGMNDCWDLYLDGSLRATGVLRTAVLPCLMTLLFGRVSAALVDKLLFHAAVLTRGDRAVLLPAEAGGGKTTLAAALAARGCGLFSDELAALDVTRLAVSPVPLPLTIKSGSVEVLSPYFPGLAGAPFHQRADGQRVHYLPPPQCGRVATGSAARVHALVFPCYHPGAETRLEHCDKAAALQRLGLTGSSQRRFTADDVEAMITVVEHAGTYELIFSDLEAAVELVEQVFVTAQAVTAGGPGNRPSPVE